MTKGVGPQFALLSVLLYILCTEGGSSEESIWEPPVQLDQDSFDSFIEGLPSTHGVVMEYYANWCPTCQHFQPDYEKIAGYFNTAPKVKPEIVVARVDCASQSKLCNRFGIGRYPTLKYGEPGRFKEGADVKLEEFTGQRTPVETVKWLGQQKGVEYNYDPTNSGQQVRQSVATGSGAGASAVPSSLAKEVELRDIEIATTLAFKYTLDSEELLKGAESRQAFTDFVDVVALAHPVDSCRAGAAKMQDALPKLWPAEQMEGPSAELKELQICSKPSPDQEWKACKSSIENKRGYTCGLWLLFHSLAGRIEPTDSGGALWMTAIKGFVRHFFQCTDCAVHFTEMASGNAAKAVASKKQAVLWMWRAHNEVNRRLEALEKSNGDGDPAFPKAQWPPAELCPLCRLPSLGNKGEITWNEEEVYRFLLAFYRGEPEAGWVTKQLGSTASLTGLGGRKTGGGSHSAGGNSWTLGMTLLLALAAVALLMFVRSRWRASRKQVLL